MNKLPKDLKSQISEEDAEKLAHKMTTGTMTVDDFIKQLKSIRRMGSMKQILGMLPGVGKALKNIQVDDKQFDSIEAIASSMTKKERKDISAKGSMPSTVTTYREFSILATPSTIGAVFK